MTKYIEILNQLLDNNHITRNKMLKDLGLGKNSIINWERRDTLPNGNTLIKIADYFGVSLDYLVGRDDTKNI